jgi:hypothetical protein
MNGIRKAFWNKYLDPGDSLGEVLFGLIMVLTFTLGEGLMAGEGRGATRALLIAALGCNLAWGIIDAVMYVMDRLFERSRAARFARRVTNARDDAQAAALLAGELDERLAPVSSEAARRAFYADVVETVRKAAPRRTTVTREDIYGGIASFWLVFVTALPAVIPFLLIENPHRALRASNALLVLMLFFVGYLWGKLTSARPWAVGLSVMLFGVALVLIAIALGG